MLAALCVSAAAHAEEVLKELPANLSLRKGQVVYVDNGKCPAGEVLKITGGHASAGVPRQTECVKRPEGR
ncbi:MAG: hypothetical protein EOO27_45115 [Comamonadaceae bacterium]|nr:MAG: hypothetical protein EOO27_45115 [Comamonadaceae bacterium]